MTEIGVKALLIGLIIILGIMTIFLGLRVMSLNADLKQMDELVLSSGDLLYATIGIDCKNPLKKVDITLDCLNEALFYTDITENDFDNFYSADYDGVGGEGYIIVKNNGAMVFTSEKFRLYQNKVLVDSDCHIPGDIKTGYTCKLEFPQKCSPGDILEVMYAPDGDSGEEVQVLLHVCEY